MPKPASNSFLVLVTSCPDKPADLGRNPTDTRSERHPRGLDASKIVAYNVFC